MEFCEGARDRVGIDADKVGPVIESFHHRSDLFQSKLRIDAQMVISVSLHITTIPRFAGME